MTFLRAYFFIQGSRFKVPNSRHQIIFFGLITDHRPLNPGVILWGDLPQLLFYVFGNIQLSDKF